MIGILIPDILNPFFSELYKSIDQYANKFNKQLYLFDSNYQIDKEKKFLNMLMSKSIDSAIIISDTLKAEDLANINIPIVTIDRKISQDISSISIDNYSGGRKALEYLTNNNCEMIGHISGPKENKNSSLRKKGFIDEAEKQNVDYIIIEGEYDIKSSIETSIQLLNQEPSLDGIFAGNDLIAIGIIKALSKINYSKKLKIIGFDGIYLGETITPEITTLSQPINRIAFEAVDIIMNNKTSHKILDVDLLIRET